MGTAISWTDQTWNPTTGCSKVSEGCRNCYAETLSLRFGTTKQPWTAHNAGANVQLHPERLRKPLAWRKPARVFVNSMSDLFHELIPDAFLDQVFAVMAETPQHTYQILTKRPERMAEYIIGRAMAPGRPDWPLPNVWLGVSVEDARQLPRIDELRLIPAAVRFISAEPLLGSLAGIDLTGIHWVIVGGESGRHMAPPPVGNFWPERWMRDEWARELRDACATAGIAYFFKQHSGTRTEMQPWLIEADGSHTVIQQYPDAPASAGDHAEQARAERCTCACGCRSYNDVCTTAAGPACDDCLRENHLDDDAAASAAPERAQHARRRLVRNVESSAASSPLARAHEAASSSPVPSRPPPKLL